MFSHIHVQATNGKKKKKDKDKESIMYMLLMVISLYILNEYRKIFGTSSYGEDARAVY